MSDSSPGPTDVSPPEAARLLGVLRALARELRPGAGMLDALGLTHSLERDFGFDSLARVELLVRIEQEFGVRLPEAAFAEADTAADLLGLLGPVGTAPRARHAGLVEPAAEAVGPPPRALLSLAQMLDWRAAQHGGRVHVTLLEGDTGAEDLSFAAARDGARALAAGLQARGVGAGERVAIMLPTGRAFFAAFYGAMYAGCVPVPLYPPARASQIEDHLRRVAGIVASAGARTMVADERIKPLGPMLRSLCPGLGDLATVAELSAAAGERRADAPQAGPQDIAFLQYTSGSTGNPKGVVLTHANLRTNLDAMAQATGIDSRDVFVSWLPLYHDMGLIGACMGSLAVGFRLVLMSPLAFLARPARWLWALHRYRGTVSAAPNFAYELCAGKLADDELAGLDLSCWRLAYNGAEPVSPQTIARFAERFAPFGFRPEAMSPVYGLAECSVGLAFPPPGRGPRIDRVDRDELARRGVARACADEGSSRAVVGCGRALPGHRIRIADADGHELPERVQGRVQFQGPSAAQGYFRNPSATAALIRGEWHNTGDLGYLADGELYLTGREKDLIIRAGQNIHPQELEEAIGRLPGVRRGGVAVFAASDAAQATERLIVLAETRPGDPRAEPDALRREIDRLAADLVGQPADDIVLAPPQTVPKTSSGKIRRAACRERYEAGTLLSGRRAPWRQWASLLLEAATGGARRLWRRWPGRAWTAWAWLVFATLVPIGWGLIVATPGLRARRRVARAMARAALWLTGLSPRTEGRHHVERPGTRLVVANHASYLDGLVLTAVLPPDFAFVAKQKLRAKPLAAIPLRRLGCAFVERFELARGADDARGLAERVRAGESMVFFPEGTFEEAPGVLPFRLGAFAAAAGAGVPVVPVALAGTRRLLPGEQLRPRFSRLRVSVGEAIVANGGGFDDVVQLRDAARGFVLAHVDEPDQAA